MTLKHHKHKKIITRKSKWRRQHMGDFRKGSHAPTFRNRKFSTRLREYSIFFPSVVMAEPDGKFSLHGSQPKNIF